MGSPRHNRSEAADYLKGNRYRLHDSHYINIGDPLKYTATGPGAYSGGPVYDTIVIVAPYDDTTSKERCLGVSDDQIPIRGALGTAERTLYDALYKSTNDWRQGRREVAIVVHGVRDMVNKYSGWVYDNQPLAPYPRGFVPWITGMTYLGKVKNGPIDWSKKGPVMIDPVHRYDAGEGWLDNGP
jgi:hypothetical protein